MSIQIHINGENAAEAIRELSVLASHLTPSSVAVPVAVTSTTEAPKAGKATRSRSITTSNDSVKEEAEMDVDKISSETTAEAAAKENENLGSDSDSSKDDESVVTVEELRAKAAEVSKSGKQADVKALLQKFEAGSISLVPDDKRSEFLKALEAL